jgi:hypothetical protein
MDPQPAHNGMPANNNEQPGDQMPAEVTPVTQPAGQPTGEPKHPPPVAAQLPPPANAQPAVAPHPAENEMIELSSGDSENEIEDTTVASTSTEENEFEDGWDRISDRDGDYEPPRQRRRHC